MGWALLVSHHKTSMPLHHFKDSVNIASRDQPEGSRILTPCHLPSLFPLAGRHGRTVALQLLLPLAILHLAWNLAHNVHFSYFLLVFFFKPGLRVELQRMLFFLTHRGKGSGCQATRAIGTFFFLKISSSHSDFFPVWKLIGMEYLHGKAAT